MHIARIRPRGLPSDPRMIPAIILVMTAALILGAAIDWRATLMALVSLALLCVVAFVAILVSDRWQYDEAVNERLAQIDLELPDRVE